MIGIVLRIKLKNSEACSNRVCRYIQTHQEVYVELVCNLQHPVRPRTAFRAESNPEDLDWDCSQSTIQMIRKFVQYS